MKICAVCIMPYPFYHGEQVQKIEEELMTKISSENNFLIRFPRQYNFYYYYYLNVHVVIASIAYNCLHGSKYLKHHM